MRTSVSSLIGVGVLLLGALVMSSWLLGSQSAITTAAGAQMVFNTALCFVLTGFALAAERFLSVDGLQRIRDALGIAMGLLAAYTLLEHALDLDFSIDFPELHRSGADGPRHPGRMSAPTAVAFLFTGTVLVWMGHVRRAAGGIAVQGLTAAVFLLGAIGFAGRAVNLPLMYPESAFARMAPQTAIGMIFVSAALWLAWRRMDWYRARTLIRSEEQRISLTGAAVLALIVCVSVLSGFAIMARQLEGAARTGLLESLKSKVQLFRITIDHRSTHAATIATRPYIAEQLAILRADVSDPSAFAILRGEAESVLSLGFSAMSFYGLHGETGGAAGGPVEQPALVLPIVGAQRTVLMWDDGFVLYSRMTVTQRGEPVGVMVAEQRLTELTEALRVADDFAASAEIRVCRRVAMEVECVRQAPPPVVFRFAYSHTLPIARAFNGTTAVVIDRDDQERLVMAAVGPIGKTGLAMVLKLDTVELYAPLRRQLYLAFVLMAAMIALGALLLRQRIAPLVRRLAANEERLGLALEGSRLALWDLDLRTQRIWLDERWQEMLGGQPAASTTTPPDLQRLVHPEDWPAVEQHFREVMKGAVSHYDVEHRVRKLSGDWLWIRSRGRVVERDANGQALRIAGTNSDIDRSKQAELQLAHQAGHDALSGLPNRNLFYDRMARATGRSRRHAALMAVMYLDIDKFKGVNDTFGHDVGDALIREFGRRLSECVRQIDTVARLGGDEFAVILEEVEDRDAGSRIAEKIVAAMRETFVLGERVLSVSTSLGLAFYGGREDSDPSMLLKQADTALYRAKVAGRNTYRVSDVPDS